MLPNSFCMSYDQPDMASVPTIKEEIAQIEKYIRIEYYGIFKNVPQGEIFNALTKLCFK